jgi:hypothetical protein
MEAANLLTSLATLSESQWWTCDFCKMSLPQGARLKIQQHKENQVVSRCAEKWDKRERAATKGGSIVTPKKARGRPRNPPAESGSKRKSPPAPAPAPVRAPICAPAAAAAAAAAGGGEQYVACTYKDGEYKLRGYYGKVEAKDLSGGNFLSSVLQEGTSKHGIRKGLYWFSAAKYKSLVALRNPKDVRWGRPCGNGGRAKGRSDSDSDLDTVEEEDEEDDDDETVVQMDEEEEQEQEQEQEHSAPPAKRNRVEHDPASSSSSSSSSAVVTSTGEGDASDAAHLKEALSRAWAQNDFLQDELARTRKDNEELRVKAQDLAAQLRAAQPSLGVVVTPSNAAAAAAAAAATMEVVVGGDDLLL